MHILIKLNRAIKSSTNSLMKSALKKEEGPKIDYYEVIIPEFCKSDKVKRVIAQEGLRVALENWRTGQSIKDFDLQITGELAKWTLK